MNDATDLDQLKRELEQRTQELSALQQAARLFGAMAKGENIYRQLAEQVAQLLNTEMCAILLYDEQERALISQAPAYGLSDEVAHAYRVSLENEAIWKLWQTSEYLVINDVTDDPLVMALGLKPLAEALGVWSTLMVLMRLEGRSLGVIQPSNKRDGSGFNQDDIRLLSIFASQAAMAIENARLYEGVSKRLAQVSSLQTVSTAMVSTLELETLLELMVEQATILLDGEGGILNMCDLDQNMEEVVATVGSTKPVQGVRGSLEDSLSGWVALYNRPLICNELGADPRASQRAVEAMKARTAVLAPLRVKGQVIGVLVVQDKEKGQGEFNQDDLDLLVAFANQAAMAIENAQLFAQTKKTLGELQALSAEQARLLEAVRELSTPLVPVTENILVLPLIGSIDSRRAQQIMETLLAGIAECKAEVVIIDITGVPMVDTTIADRLLRATRAAGLLGCQTILVGITPQVAHTIVQLGIDLSGQITRSDLKSGIEYALRLVGRRIAPI